MFQELMKSIRTMFQKIENIKEGEKLLKKRKEIMMDIRWGQSR